MLGPCPTPDHRLRRRRRARRLPAAPLRRGRRRPPRRPLRRRPRRLLPADRRRGRLRGPHPPSGVGYDIACMAAGTPVTTADGYWLPIEAVRPASRCSAGNGIAARRLARATARSRAASVELRRVTLALGRELRAHRRPPRPHPPRVEARRRAARRRRGRVLAIRRPAVRGRRTMPPALLRLLAYCAGDGHLGVDGKTLAWYSNSRDRHRAIWPPTSRRSGYPGGDLRAPRPRPVRADAPLGRAARPLRRAGRARSARRSTPGRSARSSGCSRCRRGSVPSSCPAFMSARGQHPGARPGHRLHRRPRGQAVGSDDGAIRFVAAPVRVARFLRRHAERPPRGRPPELRRAAPGRRGRDPAIPARGRVQPLRPPSAAAAAAMLSVAAQRRRRWRCERRRSQEARHLRARRRWRRARDQGDAERSLRRPGGADPSRPLRPWRAAAGQGVARRARSLGRGRVAAGAGQRADRRGRARLRRRNRRLGRVFRRRRRRRPQLRQQGRADEPARRRDPRRPGRHHGLDLRADQLRGRAQQRRAGRP